MTVSTLIRSTGETVELKADTREQVVESLLFVKEYTDAFEALRKRLNKIAMQMVDDDGPIIHNGYRLNTSIVQRMNYDPAVLREVFEDEDLLASFSEYRKTRVDIYIREHLEEMPAGSTERLRRTMVPVGDPYPTTRLERLERNM